MPQVLSVLKCSQFAPGVGDGTGAVGLVFKKNFEVVRDILIDKRFGTFVEQSEGINAHLVGNNLYAVTCEGSWLKSYKNYVYKINLTSGEVIKNEIEKEDVGKGKITFE